MRKVLALIVLLMIGYAASNGNKSTTVTAEVQTKDDKIRSICIDHAMKEFEKYEEAQGREQLEMAAVKIGVDFATYRKMMIAMQASGCYAQNKDG